MFFLEVGGMPARLITVQCLIGHVKTEDAIFTGIRIQKH